MVHASSYLQVDLLGGAKETKRPVDELELRMDVSVVDIEGEILEGKAEEVDAYFQSKTEEWEGSLLHTKRASCHS